ncbi:hypothetical protein JBP901_gp088 [Bacillus phage JBP901]|uniref:Uncharacterized protein n=1 Tax=Bacillus phage JBP901 TaxID=1498212 RepID=A0A0E3DEL7_9CAUD|nr:hypothetical protein JBP901_gp088 [Bacillus phage JBP901]AID17800.1 hypothetical protein JBP901_gp088 [Bacillus phage JBP901]
MTKLETGTLTPYKDKNGRVIKLGDRVELEGIYFEVIQNDFTDEFVIDGDTGQEELHKVAYMCEVISFTTITIPLPEAPKLTISSKYKDKDEVLKNLWDLRHKFTERYGIRVVPTTVYLGENLVTMLTEHSPYTTVFGVKIVEVMETDHMSLGLTLQKH